MLQAQRVQSTSANFTFTTTKRGVFDYYELVLAKVVDPNSNNGNNNASTRPITKIIRKDGVR